MKVKSLIIVCVAVSMVFSACRQNENNTAEQQAESDKEERLSEEELLKQIENKEKKLHDELELDLSVANEMILLYLDYANKFENDSLVPEYLFRAAELAMNADKPYDAVAYLKRIEEEYPGFNKMAEVVYLTGFIYDSILDNDEEAENYYRKFLKKWPDHDRAEEVEALISYLNMSDLELVRQFEENNKNVE
ncbi:MAG: tetratricopeptide repeat protein [Bacteroidales bacterium]